MELARPWIEEARRRLLSARTSDGTWGYQRTTQAAVEATAVCGLSLLASSGAESAGIEVEVGAAADWLASVQNDNGSLGVSGMVRRPEWPTPYALLLWSALGGYQEQRMIAVRWLLRWSNEQYREDFHNSVSNGERQY